MDIDKDAAPRPPSATRRKRPSVVKCTIVLCSLIGFLIVGLFLWFMGKGLYSVYDNARNPYKDLYLNSTTVESGSEAIAWPFINKDERFDVYFTVWARVPDAEAVGEKVDAEEAASRERFGSHLDTIKKLAKYPERELLVDPVEQVLFSERVFENVGMKDMNLHKDISFELPLDRFRDKLIYHGDIRGAAVIVPRSDIFDKVKSWTGWKPEGAKSLVRINDETAATLGLSGLKRDLLDATSVSFALVELHDKNYIHHNSTTDGEEEEEHEYFKEEGWTEKEGESMTERYKRWSTEQPHFVSKSHVFILDETRPFNLTAFDKKHNDLKDTSCGQLYMSMALPPTRFLCSRIPFVNGVWENRLVGSDEEGGDEKVMYGPYVNVLSRMAGPKHITPLPVRRGKPFDPAIDQKSVTANHQITFSAFSSGRLHLIENFLMTGDVDKNATETALVQAHSDWEQSNGVLGNRAHGTHPRTRLILTIVEDVGLSLPITILSLLYWYTRQTAAGLHSLSVSLISFGIIFQEVYFVYYGGKSKTVNWDMYIFAIAFSTFDLVEAILMIRLIVPFEVIWGDWLPKGFRRVRWSKRERNTRRLERKVDWVSRGAIFAIIGILLAVTQHYDLFLVNPLHRMPNEHADASMSTTVSSIVNASKLTALILQLMLNRHASTFAGQYALHAYMVVIRRGVQLLKFWPWFVGRYEVRGGIAWSTVPHLIVEGLAAWQALTLPRVEQVVKEDEEDE